MKKNRYQLCLLLLNSIVDLKNNKRNYRPIENFFQFDLGIP